MAKINILFFTCIFLSIGLFAQPTHVINDPARVYKEVRDHVNNGRYAMAYPLVKGLKDNFPLNDNVENVFMREDIVYFDILCRLKLDIEAAALDAVAFIRTPGTIPREQLMSFHLAHFYFTRGEYEDAVEYFSKAGFDNLTNDQIADAKFEKAYSYFNLRQFKEAKPLFNEIYQLPDHKYYYDAAYYYGFISYYQKDNDEAMKAFRVVENREEYKGVVPYYIAEIYYFQGKKDDALKYGESVLARSSDLYYQDQLKLLMGQMYFEKKNFKKAVPLLEDYVNKSSKVSREVMYELSYSYYKEGLNEKAMEGFKQLSSEKDSLGQNSMYLLGDLYLKAGQKENARNAFQYSAYNSSNTEQQKVSRFQYAKISYELGYQDVALKEMRSYLKDYPGSDYESEAREILIAMLGTSNNYAEALSLYKEVAKPTPAMKKVYPRILYGRSVELINEQKTSEAGSLLQEVINDPAAGPVLPYAHFWLGEIEYRNGNYDASVRNLTKFREANPAAQGEANMRSAAYTLGYDHYQLGNYKQAAGFLEQVAPKISAKSSNIEQDAFCRAADCYYMSRDFDKARSMYDQVISNNLSLADHATFQKAMIAGIRNSNEKISILSGMAKKYPNSNLLLDADMEVAQTYMTDEKFREAIPYLNKVLSAGDESAKPKAYLKLGLAHYNSNNNKEALDAFRKLADKYPNSPETGEALSIIKEIYVEEGRSDEYVSFMKDKGINIAASEADSLSYATGQAKFESDDCTGAVKAFSNYLKSYPEGAYALDAYYFRSECYRRAKDWIKALEGYKAVNEKGPSRHFDRATLEAARIYYLELKDYGQSRKYFESLLSVSANPEFNLEALRGLVRSYYQLRDFTKASDAANRLLASNGISTDDRSVAYLVLGKSQQLSGDCPAAITSFRSVASANRSSWGAEARYEMAVCYFNAGNFTESEKAAMSVIKETGAYDDWVTRSYILLGDIFYKQEDFFNAKATYESVARNASIPELKTEAAKKLEAAEEAERKKSKISNPQPK